MSTVARADIDFGFAISPSVGRRRILRRKPPVMMVGINSCSADAAPAISASRLRAPGLGHALGAARCRRGHTVGKCVTFGRAFRFRYRAPGLALHHWPRLSPGVTISPRRH